jgi:dCTP diphosphatase
MSQRDEDRTTMRSRESEVLIEHLRSFADERDWGQFHDPKNLSMALSVEAGELMEIFQWLTPMQAAEVMSDPKSAEAVEHELADVYAYLLRLSDILGVSLEAALARKLIINGEKYPVGEFKGSARKYNTRETS